MSNRTAEFQNSLNERIDAAKRTPSGAEFSSQGFYVDHTGGGCLAWRLDADDTEGLYILVTSGDGTDIVVDENDPTDCWLVGPHWQNDTGTEEFYLDCTTCKTFQEAMGTAKIFAIALKFASDIRNELSANQFFKVLERNRDSKYSETCATHDFCDANMPMLHAFRYILNREPDMENDADIGVMNTAWQMAKSCEFLTKPDK